MQVLPADNSGRLVLSPAFALVCLGLLSILAQVALLRELTVAFYGVELIYLLGLGIWLLWTSAGAMPVRLRRQRASMGLIAFLFLALALLLPLEVVFTRYLRLLFGGVSGAYLPFGRQMLASCIALLPSGVLFGWLFPLLAAQLAQRRQTVALAYAWESAGGLVGGLLATMFLRWGFQNFTVVMLCAIGACATAFALAGRRRIRQIYALCLLALSLCTVFLSRSADRAMTAWNHPGLVGSVDTPYGRVTLRREAGQLSVFENDALSFDTEGTDAELFVRTAALQLEKPARVLILGGGISGILSEILRHHPSQVDCVELNRRMFVAVLPHLPQEMRQSLHDGGVRLLFADPRTFLRHAVEQYDLILVGMPEPASGQTNRFYTREFFDLCAARLAPGGVVAFRLHSAENYWSPLLTYRSAGIYRALAEALPHVVVLPGSTNIFLASPAPLSTDGKLPAARLQQSGIRPRLVTPRMIHYLYSNDRFRETAELLQKSRVPANSDSRPVCYQYAVLLWLSMFIHRISSFEAIHFNVRGGVAVILVVSVGLLLLRIRPGLRRSALAGVAGFIGMVIETVLILDYQTGRGALFQDLGILLMSFMAGLAAGALAIHRLATRRRASVWWGVLLMAAFAVLSASTGMLRPGDAFGLAGASALLAAAGFLVAAVFAYASLQGDADQATVAAPLYAADLLGGCLASVLCSLILIPSLGMKTTALTMAALSLCGLLLL